MAVVWASVVGLGFPLDVGIPYVYFGIPSTYLHDDTSSLSTGTCRDYGHLHLQSNISMSKSIRVPQLMTSPSNQLELMSDVAIMLTNVTIILYIFYTMLLVPMPRLFERMRLM